MRLLDFWEPQRGLEGGALSSHSLSCTGKAVWQGRSPADFRMFSILVESVVGGMSRGLREEKEDVSTDQEGRRSGYRI